MAVVDPDSVEVVDFATVWENAQKKGMIVMRGAGGGPPYKLIQGQETILISESLVEIQAELEGNTIAKIGDVFYDLNVGPMIVEAAGSFPLKESDMPGAEALHQYLYTATSGWNDDNAIDNFDDLVQQWTRRERMTEPTSPDPYAYTPTSEQYTMKLITEGRMDEALAFNNMMREFTEERMTEEEMSQRAASLARTPEEYRAWMDAMLGDREPVSEDVGQRRTIADQERTRNEMLEKTAGMTLEEMRQADPFTLLPSQLEAAGMTENGVLKPEYATPFDPDQIPDVVQAWMDKTFPEWRKYPRATTGDTKSATAGMLLDRADEGEGVDRGLLPISSLGSSGMGDTPLERMKAIADSGLSREEIAKLLENRIALAEAERLGQSWTPDTSEQYRTITPSWGGDPVAHKGVFPIPRQTRGPILEEEFGGSAGYELALEAARRAEILGRTGALMKHTGKTGKIGMSRFRTTPEERAFIESTGGIEAYGEAVPSYSGRVEYVPTTDTYLLDEGDQVIPTPEKTKQKPIKSLQQGTNYVGQSGPYGLHAGEIVSKYINPFEDYGTDIFASDYYRRRKNKEGSWGINQKPSSSPV